MPNNPVYSPGVHNVGSFQSSGTPFLTGGFISSDTEHVLEFPFITKSFTLKNTGSADIRIHFASKDEAPAVLTNHNYFTIGSGASLTYDVKCRYLYISCTSNSGFEIAAEITGIDKNRMFELSGSGINA